jgi:hypothetical protein
LAQLQERMGRATELLRQHGEIRRDGLVRIREDDRIVVQRIRAAFSRGDNCACNCSAIVSAISL